MAIVKINENISYIPATKKPFSCDVVFVTGKNFTWIFDVGTSKEASDAINKITTPKNIVISHFHPDHILNLGRVSYDNLYVSKNTKKYTVKGTVVEDDIVFDDFAENLSGNLTESFAGKGLTGNLTEGFAKKGFTGNLTENLAESLTESSDKKMRNQIKIFTLPSSHAKGSLCLCCGDYCFMGDGTYAKEKIGNHTYNAQLLLEMIEKMEMIDSAYFCLSHDKNFIQKKETVLALYKDIYKRRSPKKTVISVEDFFNTDGSVKEI